MDVKTGWGWQQESLCIWSRWLPNAAKKKKKNHWMNTSYLCEHRCAYMHTYPNKDGLSCISFLSRFLLSLSYVYLSLWKGCASVSLLSLAHSLLASSLTFIEHSNECSDLPALCAQKLFVCVHRFLALWLVLLFCINKWVKSQLCFSLEKNNRWNDLVWCQCV